MITKDEDGTQGLGTVHSKQTPPAIFMHVCRGPYRKFYYVKNNFGLKPSTIQFSIYAPFGTRLKTCTGTYDSKTIVIITIL